MSSKNYKETTTLEQRIEECNRIRSKHPDRIPVIVQKAEKSDIPDIDKKKFLHAKFVNCITIHACNS